MSESSEFIGSMPSMPQPEPRQQTSQQKPKPSNVGNFIGFFLCAVCFLVFPTYAHTDDLGTGIFYGMGMMLILLLVLVLCSWLAKRIGKKKPPKATKARA